MLVNISIIVERMFRPEHVVTNRSCCSCVDDRRSIVPQQDVDLGSNLPVNLWHTAVVEKRPDTDIECNRQTYTVSCESFCRPIIHDQCFINT